MTEQERQLIQGLTTRIQNAPPPQIDREADELIRRSITRPDALYLLVQTVLIQDMALNQAKAQIDDLKQRASATPGSASGFLPNEPNARPAQPGDWGRDTHVQQPAPQSAQYQGGGYPPPPSGYQPPPPPPSGGGMGGFLRNAATTAAGVIAGETAFSALSSIFGHHGGYGEGSGFLSGGPVSPGSETIVNNYYEDDRDRGNDRDDDRSADDDVRSIDDQGDQNDDQNYDEDVDDSSLDDSGSDDDGSVDV
jgi:hypothetical protein